MSGGDAGPLDRERGRHELAAEAEERAAARLVRGSTDRLRLDWEDGRAVGPDGTEYMIQTERPLHEGTLSYAMLKRPGMRAFVHNASPAAGRARDCPYGDDETVREAKRVCEFDAWDRAGRPS